jgi:pyridoxal 5'-phosphate synthase pdxT subunit
VARVGVLALQGGFAAHAKVLARLGHTVVEVRTPEALRDLDGLVLPGGESTTQLKLIARAELEEPLRAFVASGRPVLATCAGLILAARCVSGPEQRSFGWLDVAVERNAFGRQLDSFEAVTDAGLPALFIRAPRIREVGPRAEVIDRWKGEPIIVKQGNVVGASCHPELTESTVLHARVFGDATR